jgi:hypothetical protein
VPVDECLAIMHESRSDGLVRFVVSHLRKGAKDGAHGFVFEAGGRTKESPQNSEIYGGTANAAPGKRWWPVAESSLLRMRREGSEYFQRMGRAFAE